MKKFICFFIVIITINSLLYSCSQQLKVDKNKDLQVSAKGIKYQMDPSSTYEPFDGSIDIYGANEKDLKKLSLVKYEKTFGAIPDERTAIDIAGTVLDETYGKCSKDEMPFKIKYNQNAESWIVHGELPPNIAGGVGSIAIKKETGEILLLIHTK